MLQRRLISLLVLQPPSWRKAVSLSIIEPERLNADAMFSEKEHPGSRDSKSHLTAVFEDDDDKHVRPSTFILEYKGVRLAN